VVLEEVLPGGLTIRRASIEVVMQANEANFKF